MAAKAKAKNLGEFEGRTITKTTIVLKNAGDGLSKAQKVDPVLLHQGDTVYVVFETEVGPVKFKPLGDLEEERVHELIASAATIVDADVVQEAIDSMKERIRSVEDAEAGVRELPTAEALAREHKINLHDTPVDGCPACAEASGL